MIDSGIPMPEVYKGTLRAKYEPVIEAMKSGDSMLFENHGEAARFRQIAYKMRVFFVGKSQPGGAVRLWRKDVGGVK